MQFFFLFLMFKLTVGSFLPKTHKKTTKRTGIDADKNRQVPFAINFFCQVVFNEGYLPDGRRQYKIIETTQSIFI